MAEVPLDDSREADHQPAVNDVDTVPRRRARMGAVRPPPGRPERRFGERGVIGTPGTMEISDDPARSPRSGPAGWANALGRFGALDDVDVVARTDRSGYPHGRPHAEVPVMVAGEGLVDREGRGRVRVGGA